MMDGSRFARRLCVARTPRSRLALVALCAAVILAIGACQAPRAAAPAPPPSGAAASGTEIIANRVLQAYGLDPETDIQRERLGVADSSDGLRDGKLDAFFWSGGLPTAQIQDLSNSAKLVFLDQADGIQKMADR